MRKRACGTSALIERQISPQKYSNAVDVRLPVHGANDGDEGRGRIERIRIEIGRMRAILGKIDSRDDGNAISIPLRHESDRFRRFSLILFTNPATSGGQEIIRSESALGAIPPQPCRRASD